MKTVIVTAAVLGLLAFAPAASAQEDHNKAAQPQGARPGGPGGQSHDQGRGPGGPGGGGGGHNAAPAERGPARGPETPNGGARNGPTSERAQAQGPSRQGANERTHGAPTADRTPERPAGQNPGRASDRAVGATNPGSRGVQAAGRNANAGPARRTADVAAFRGNVQAPRHFRAGAYRPPQGFQSRHWGYGDRLPQAYYARSYWLTNFLTYGLLSPPSGLVWVRVGPDALLIDQYTGEVIRAEYGVFY
jgi:Ni/Co efflux regulator RcnB